jgi:ribose transport system permease protein
MDQIAFIAKKRANFPATLWSLVSQAAGARELYIPTIVLLVLIVVTSIFAPGMLQWRALSNFGVDASPLLVTVVGGTLPILLGSIDLSVAGMASLAGVLTVELEPQCGALTALLVVGACAAVGGLQGFIQGWAQIPSFVTTLGMLGVLSGISLLISGATAKPVPTDDIIINYFAGKTFGMPNSILVVLGVVVGLGVLMRMTRFGRDIYAVGASERTAILSGVRTLRVRTLAFAISGAASALGGLLLLAQTSFSSPSFTGNLLLLAIVGVVIGGTAISGGVGGLSAGVIGGLIAAWLRVFTVVIGINPAAQGMVFGIMAIFAVALTTDREKIGVIK